MNMPHLKNEKYWLVWKFQVQYALKAADQWQFVIGMVNADADDYESKKQKAFYSILQCIGQKFMPMVMSCRDPQEMWNTLYQFFERRTVSNKVYTLMQLYSLRTYEERHLYFRALMQDRRTVRSAGGHRGACK